MHTNTKTLICSQDCVDTERATPPALSPRRIALVAYDGSAPNRSGDAPFPLGTHLRTIAQACSEYNCDAIFFAPWTASCPEAKPLRAQLFPRATAHRWVILGVTHDAVDGEIIEVWSRESPEPFGIKQRFATSSAPESVKRQLYERFGERVCGDTAIVVCGEVNVLRVPRGTRTAADEYGVLSALRDQNAHILFNPTHTYMRRYEVALKREALSRNSRVVVAVWNRGLTAGPEARVPWQTFHNEEDITFKIEEQMTPLTLRIGVRIGVLDVDLLHS